ncbi:hypothetical protein ACFFOS_16920 [Nocardioides kongjuensis]|uniref:VOC family protein n=1 Tax=Nocardioides kongjuensis TaxID=349522 RepID=A0A852RT91_9ACTN|nr:hypothetical protein [Nocardioides kongjuensis]
MTTRLNPYLSFAGDASAALAFYQDVFGGDLTINHFGDFGTDDHGIGDQVMHGQLETASGLTLMAADMLPGETLRPGKQLRGQPRRGRHRGNARLLAGAVGRRDRDGRDGHPAVGRRVRDVRRPVRDLVAGQHRWGQLTYPIRDAPGRSGCPSVLQVGDAAAGDGPRPLRMGPRAPTYTLDGDEPVCVGGA